MTLSVGYKTLQATATYRQRFRNYIGIAKLPHLITGCCSHFRNSTSARVDADVGKIYQPVASTQKQSGVVFLPAFCGLTDDCRQHGMDVDSSQFVCSIIRSVSISTSIRCQHFDAYRRQSASSERQPSCSM